MSHPFDRKLPSDVLTPERCDVECLHPDIVRPLLDGALDAPGSHVVARLFAVLADPTRLRLLDALARADELCVCDLALVVGQSVSAVSHQLRLLRDRQVVVRRKAGRIVYYQLADAHVRRLLADALGHAREGGIRAEPVPAVA